MKCLHKILTQARSDSYSVSDAFWRSWSISLYPTRETSIRQSFRLPLNSSYKLSSSLSHVPSSLRLPLNLLLCSFLGHSPQSRASDTRDTQCALLVLYLLIFLTARIPYFALQWFPVTITVLYRLVIALFLTGWLLYSPTAPSNGGTKWFIFLSNWCFLLLTLYFICATIISALHYKEECKRGEYDVSIHEPVQWSKPSPRSSAKPRDSARDAPRAEEQAAPAQVNPLDIQLEIPMAWYHEALWVMYNIAANSALVLTILYWTTLKPAQKTNGLEFTVHALNSVFVLIETMLGMFPVRVLHVIHSVLFSITYVMFTFIYWACGGTNLQGQTFIYEHLDYTGNPGQAVGMLLGWLLLGHPLSQIALYGLYRLRYWLCTKYSEKLGPLWHVDGLIPIKRQLFLFLRAMNTQELSLTGNCFFFNLFYSIHWLIAHVL